MSVFHRLVYSLRYAQAHLVTFLPFGHWTVWLPEHRGSHAVQTSGVTDNGQSDAIYFMPLAGVKRSTHSSEPAQSLKPKVSSDNKSGRN